MEEKDIKRQALQLFRRIDRGHKKLCEKRFEELGLHRGQHIMLMTLGRFDAPIAQKTLAGALGVSEAATAMGLKRLLKRGYIEKTTSPLDGRYHEVQISESGREVIERSRQIFDEIDDLLIRGIRDEELSAFTKTLKKLYDNLEQGGARQ